MVLILRHHADWRVHLRHERIGAIGTQRGDLPVHTVRNRKGARPRRPTSAKPPVHPATQEKAPAKTAGKSNACQETRPPFLLAQPRTAGFPADLILPPHRGAIITTAAWPAGMIPAPLPAAPPLRAPFVLPRVPAGNPQGQPGREAPGRDSRQQEPPRKTPHRDLPPRPGTRTARKAERRAMAQAEWARRTGIADDAGQGTGQPLAGAPSRADPIMAPDDRSPLPRHLAPAVARAGLFDTVAASLGDAGRFLARLLPGARRGSELRERVARAEARLRAMEAQLSALEALRERVKA
jgi:hypothetical protein